MNSSLVTLALLSLASWIGGHGPTVPEIARESSGDVQTNPENALTILGGARATPEVAQTASGDLVLLTFNIRYGAADDGPNAWPNRRAQVAEIIRSEAPDVLAIQEGLAFQLEEMEEVLAEYRKLGQHRDGGLEGEFSGLYVRESRVRVLQWGELWLSSTPDSVGSVGWDAALPRMVVWVDIEGVVEGSPVRVYGTHFDHRGEVARLESARLITQHAVGGPPAIVMGDFNAPEGSPPLKVFSDLGYRSAFHTMHPRETRGTFNGFRDPSGGERIDHILVDPGLTILRGDILSEVVDGVWPSDHFPVVAMVRLGALNLLPLASKVW